ncbi:MAG: helicase [Proteobacteria bacterium]|nr:helicase [Pseudomonadota bacterium]MBU1060542.1 helicase [Pseudomonadota bacterium]
MIKGTPLKLFDDEIVRAAKRRQITEWPDSKRFPLNFDSMRVEQIVREDLKASASPLIITGFTSLDYLIDFVADLPIDQTEKICILLGSEPSPARRQDYSLGSSNFPQEVTDYWLEVGISLRLCHKIVLFIDMIRGGRVESRYIPDQRHKLHAKIYVADGAITLGSSNFSFNGQKNQLEANARFDATADKKRYNEVWQIAKNYWELGEDYNQELLGLLEMLLSVVSWQEALGRACAELLEGHWAEKYIKTSYVSSGKQLWPSQKTGIAQALWMVENVGSVLVADATGAGKTRMGAHLLRSVMDRIWSTGRVRKDVTVLVSPPKVVESAWQREAVECGLPLSTLSHGLLSRKGSEKSDDAISTIRRAQSLAVDEAHNFLNQKSSRTRSLLGNMADVVVMFTATPINKGARDLLRIVDILGADNLEDSALKIFERLERRMRSESNQFVTTPEERKILQKEVQRFTLRRTKSILNRMVDEDPDAYCDDRGKKCRYPIHNPKTYKTGETAQDQELAGQIRELATKLKGLLNLQSGIDIPVGWRGDIDEDKYIHGRIQGARGLAIYHVMSRLRSSKAALVEHLLGTQVACDQFGIIDRIKTEDSGNVIRTLAEGAGKIRESSIVNKLPEWLTESESHRRAIEKEIQIYKKILELVEKISDKREQSKSLKLAELIKKHPLILAFDSCLISLEIIKKNIEEFNKNIRSIVATGTQLKNKSEVNRLFALGSEAHGVIALCSDAMSEGLNLQQASAVLLLDMPSVIRIAEQRVGRVDRMNSPHKEIEVWWPEDSDAYSLKTDRKFFRRYSEVKDILGSNLELPENLIPEELSDTAPSTVEEMVEKLDELDKAGQSWDGIQDAFQPVKELVDPEIGIVPVEIYKQLRKSKARVISSVSLIKSERPWAFFAIGGVDRGAPKWVYLDNWKAKPVTHLADVAQKLKEHLQGDVENREMDSEASLLIEKFLNQILSTEKELLPRKKQRALFEMEMVLNYYDKKAKEREDWERKDLIKSVLDLLSVPDNDQGRPDLDKVAEAWLDLTRDVWYEKLLSRKNRNKILRLKDIRKDLEQKPIDNERLHNAFSSVKIAQSIHTRVVAAIVGVPGN